MNWLGKFWNAEVPDFRPRSLSLHSISLLEGADEQKGSIKWTYGTVVERGTGYGDRGERGRGGLRASCGLDVACDCGIRGCGCCCGGGARAVHVNRARWIGRRERPALRPTVAGRVRRRRRESGLRCGRLVVVHHCNEPASMFILLSRSSGRRRRDEDEPRRSSSSPSAGHAKRESTRKFASGFSLCWEMTKIVCNILHYRGPVYGSCKRYSLIKL